MNLLEKLKGEIESLNLTEELEIAYYIYMRMGQIFEYDASYIYANEEERNRLKIKRLNKNNVKTKNIYCFMWAPFYSEILNELGINAKTKESKKHAYVKIYINNNKYVADLTKDYEDLMRMKLGLNAENFYKTVAKENKPDKKEIVEIENRFYQKGLKTKDVEVSIHIKERILNVLKKEMVKRVGTKKYHEEYNYQAFRVISDLINNLKTKLGYVSGAKFISYLIEFFHLDYSKIKITYFYDCNQEVYIEIYSMLRNGNIYYFGYQKMDNGEYELREVPSIYVESLKNVYCTKYAEDLLLEQEDIYTATLKRIQLVSVK